MRITPWCDITIDGQDYGRSPTKKAIELSPGHHTLVCAQTGAGGKSVTVEFDLDPGEREVIKRTLHARIEVTIDVTVEVVSIDGTRHARGDTVSLSPGRHRVALYEKGAVVYEGYVQFPTTECTLRDNPELGCY